LQFQKPKDFNYKAGQWLRIASTGISTLTFHPFTISSAPHEKFLSVHVRAVGPWTKKLRQVYNPNLPKIPPLLVDGPFGSPNDTWANYENVIFVGAGIGVTPYASILKDFSHKRKNKECQVKKLIFFWICRSQKQFEWMVDIIREAEQENDNKSLEVHIFVTELNEKFDLRTIMLYICEKQFYKIHNASLFTGLQAATHFGRPNFYDLFSQIQENIHTDEIPVFTCTPGFMNEDIAESCARVSNQPGPRFLHHDDSFY